MASSERDPEDRSKFLGPPPLLKTENDENYKALHKQVESYIRPVDFLGDLTVREVTDAIWEAQRYKRYQSALIESAFHGALVQALTQIHQTDDWLARKQADEFFDGAPEKRGETLALLQRFGVSLEMLHAVAMSSNSSSIAVLERMIGNRKSSRSKMLRDNDQLLRHLAKPIPGSIVEI